MRLSSLSIGSFSLVSAMLMLASCSSQVVTQGGNEGGQGGDGGASSGHQGGSKPTSSVGGSAGSLSSGGNSAEWRESARGGEAARGGTSSGGASSGGTSATAQGGESATTSSSSTAVGGASNVECDQNTPCVNPSVTTCNAPTCVNGKCIISLRDDLGEDRCAGDIGCNSTAIDGFWGPDDSPYVVYASSPTRLNFQKLRSDSTANGGSVPFTISGSSTPTRLAARVSGQALGIMFSAKTPGFDTIQFLQTNLSFEAATQVTLSNESTSRPLNYPGVYLDLAPHSAGQWMLAAFVGTEDDLWVGYSGPVTSTTTLSYLSNPVHSLLTAHDDHYGLAVVDDVAVFAGNSESGYKNPIDVEMSLEFRSLTELTLLRQPLNLGPVEKLTVNKSPAALAKIGSNVGVLWNTATGSDGVLKRAVVTKSGDFVVNPTEIPGGLRAKALVPTPAGGALLIASRPDFSGASPLYTPVVQLLDATLSPVGQPKTIGKQSAYDIKQVRAVPSNRGDRTLLTYTRDDSYITDQPYRRILHTSLCQ